MFTKLFMTCLFSGLVFAVDTVKSVILALACAEKFITTERAAYLSRLEEEFQVCIHRGDLLIA